MTGHRVIVSELGEDPMQAVADHARLEPMPRPDPATLAAHDVLVEIRSASVGWVDLLMTSGQYQHAPKPPYTPGLEYAGTVAWAGPEVTHVRAGDRVLVDGFLAGPRSLGAYQAWGGFASWGVAPREAVLAIPGDLSFDEACNLLGNYETAYHCLVTRGQLKAGETVLIHGASGSTGLAAVHIAKLLGATVIATGRSDTKLAAVAAQGADHVINIAPVAAQGADPTIKIAAVAAQGADPTINVSAAAAQGADPAINVSAAGIRPFRDDVKALTAGRGVDVVYDGVGGDISIESLRCVRFGARFLIVGWAATPFVARGKGQRGAPNANVLPTNLIMMKGLSVLGCPTVISTVEDPALRPPRLAAILDWARAGKLRPRVSHVFPLADFKTAMRAKWQGEVLGGCVLHP